MANDSNHLARLIRECATGNEESYRTLYGELVDRVFAFVRSRTGSRDDAIDLTQEVFVDLWKALPRFVFHSPAQFYAFVFVITKRKLAEYYGKRRYGAEFLHDELVDERASVPGEEQIDAIRRALDTLDPTSRDIVVLHHWSRYTFGEIAKLLDMRESAVRVRHHRALKSIRSQFE